MFVSFLLTSAGKKEMILYAAKFKRSKVDISTFPFQDELDQPWRNTLWADPRKRKTPNVSSPGPNKKVRVEPITHPLLTLIQPMIPQPIPELTHHPSDILCSLNFQSDTHSPIRPSSQISSRSISFAFLHCHIRSQNED
jgi:hypothetical protein